MAKRLSQIAIALGVATIALGASLVITQRAGDKSDAQRLFDNALVNARTYQAFSETALFPTGFTLTTTVTDQADYLTYTKNTDSFTVVAPLHSNAVFVQSNSNHGAKLLADIFLSYGASSNQSVVVPTMTNNTWYYIPTADRRIGMFDSMINRESLHQYFSAGVQPATSLDTQLESFDASATNLRPATLDGQTCYAVAVRANYNASFALPPSFSRDVMYISKGAQPLPVGINLASAKSTSSAATFHFLSSTQAASYTVPDPTLALPAK